MATLKPCPYCNNTNYEYGWSFAEYIVETAATYAKFKFGNVAAIGKIVSSGGSGLGVFSIPKLFYQGVVLGLDGNPLLRCKHCNHPVVCCHKCENFMVLERNPGVAELTECPFCQAQFQVSETNDEFDQLLR